MRILTWHVHGAWSTAFVHGPHEYLIPTVPDRGPLGRGRPRTYRWPGSAREVAPGDLRGEHVDLVLAQRPEELGLAEQWLGRRPGRDVPVVYVEHNAPQGRIQEMRHPMADRDDVVLVHVTHFNALFWDAGGTDVRVIEHGIPDPGPRYTGEIARSCVVVNEPGRRGRVTGTDLLGRLDDAAPIDLFGIASEELGGLGDVPHERLLDEMARRRLYLHPVRWTSLGLSLLEAMHLGMPVVALATTEVADAVPDGAGVVSNRLDVLREAIAALVEDPEEARRIGREARHAALARFGLGRFLDDWNRLIAEVTS